MEKKTLPVFHFDSRNLPALSYGEVLPMDSSTLLEDETFWSAIKNMSSFSIEDESLSYLDKLIEKYPDSEIALFQKLNEKIPSHEIIYVGNSLVVRFFELTQKKNFNVLGNRGVNGIDGQLSSALGVSLGVSENVYCLLGDITTFYDLSSLRDLTPNFFLVIMNNNGGRIFDLLNLDQRIILEHHQDFRKISESLGLSYSNDIKDLGKVRVLELFPDQEQSQNIMREWGQ
jgi:2-succinyl-5-enolpyruvyl-6-hydroxy-3-cyclohexene-1-carboxylate synthase